MRKIKKTLIIIFSAFFLPIPLNKPPVKNSIIEALESLTEKEKLVVQLYYYEEFTLKEISNAMEVSESRVSQLHSKALRKMKSFLGDNFALLMG